MPLVPITVAVEVAVVLSTVPVIVVRCPLPRRKGSNPPLFPDVGTPVKVKVTDEGLIAMIEDRSNKVKTGEPFEPSGKYGSFEETVEEFKTKRKEHIGFVKNTQDDLRNRYQQLPFGTIDAYQILLFMSGHTERHIKQMEEVLDDEDFPMD